ncbi:flagellar protein FlgN [Lentibacillus lipolyticus]|nr:flagellar protein FlgN [Lentibacillus lipolyticus]
MTVQPIIQTLEKLIRLYESFLSLSKEKTDIVKEGSASRLQSLLIKEQKHVQAVEQADTKRREAVREWAVQQNADPDKVTITTILEAHTDASGSKELEALTVKLTNILAKLKKQEHLNRELIKQSLQFVELSLDMMSPTIRNMNYGEQSSSGTLERSVFDSKA